MCGRRTEREDEMTRKELIEKLSDRGRPAWYRFDKRAEGRPFATCDFHFSSLDAELVDWLNTVDLGWHIRVTLSDSDPLGRVEVVVFCDIDDAPPEVAS